MAAPDTPDAPFDRATRPLVGVVHLPPLVGPDAPGAAAVVERAASDARAYGAAGFDAVLVENFGDAPFPRDRSLPHVPALVARAAAAAREASGLPVGVNVLRNDVRSALGAAWAAGGAFVRVNVHAGATVSDQGVLEGDAHGTLAYRRALGVDTGAARVRICADVDVKHGAPLVARPIEEVAHELAQRAHADVLLVTGTATGAPVDPAALSRVVEAVPDRPVWAASGVDPENVADVLSVAHGAIVGTSVKRDGVTTAPVDPARARALATAADAVRRSLGV